MYAQKWNGVGGYDLFLTLTEQEMRELTNHYHVDRSYYTDSSKRRSIDDEYYCFVCFSRRAVALIPFLSIAFGGQYNDESPIGETVKDFDLDYSKYKLEEFNFELSDGSKAIPRKGLKGLLKRFLS